MINVVMHGCNGKMGQAISNLIASDEQVTLVAGIDAVDFGKNPYPVYDSLDKLDVPCDVIIDFSIASAVDGLLDYCVAKRFLSFFVLQALMSSSFQRLRKLPKR